VTDKLLGDLTMEDLSKIRKMSPTDAESFLRNHILTKDELDAAMRLAGRDRLNGDETVQIHSPSRRMWFVAAWLAGASWRQLARLHDIAPQTVTSVADRLLSSPERQHQRLRQEMSLESLEAYRKSFMLNKERFSLMRPQEVAQWLLDNTELDK
jgi:hypothetical protein